MVRRYTGDKRSIEARSINNGQSWTVKLFNAGRLTEYDCKTIAEIDALATKHDMKPEQVDKRALL